MKYTDKYINILKEHFKDRTPGWLTPSDSSCFHNMCDLYANLQKTDKCLLINFHKHQKSYINNRVKEVICVSICETEDEKQFIANVYNRDNELFEFIFTEDEFYAWIEKMNFDKIIMNPPYTCGKSETCLHLKIVQKAIEKISKNGLLVNLSPVTWLQDATAKYKKNGIYKTYKDSVAKHIKNVEVISCKDAQEIFSTPLNNDLGIYTCVSGDGNFDCSSLVNKDKTKVFETIVVPCKLDKLKSILRAGSFGIDKVTKYHCNLSVIHGNDDAPDFYDVITPEKENVRGPTKSNRTLVVNFNSDKEAENFRKSLLLIFYKYINFTYKKSKNLEFSLMPWMGDVINPRTGLKGYKSEWTNEDFKIYFNITDDEWQIIETTMENYK